MRSTLQQEKTLVVRIAERRLTRLEHVKTAMETTEKVDGQCKGGYGDKKISNDL